MQPIRTEVIHFCKPCALTGLVGGDVYGDVLGRVWALIGHSINSLDLERVESVCPQVADDHPGVCEAQLLRHKVHVVVAVRAGPPVRPALLTHDVINHVLPAAGLAGRVPLQDHGGLVHDGDDVPRAGWNACGGMEEDAERFLKPKNAVNEHFLLGVSS